MLDDESRFSTEAAASQSWVSDHDEDFGCFQPNLFASAKSNSGLVWKLLNSGADLSL